MANTQKKELVKKIVDSISTNKNFILVKYKAINTQTFNQLKTKLKQADSTLTIIKNTLFEKAINIQGKNNKELKDLKTKFLPLKEPTAVVYLGKNWSPALKIFYDFVKDIKNFSFKLGILDEEIYDTDQLLKISKLPSRDQLLAKIIASFKSPSQKLVYSMNFNINKFVYLLRKKGGEVKNNV